MFSYSLIREDYDFRQRDEFTINMILFLIADWIEIWQF